MGIYRQLSNIPTRLTTSSDSRILVEFSRDFPRLATDGKDKREALEEAMDALGSDLSIRLSRREEIPAPSAAKRGQRLVPVHCGSTAETGSVPRDAGSRR